MGLTLKDFPDYMRIRPISSGDTDLLFRFFESLSDASRVCFYPHPFDRSTAEYVTGEELSDPNIRRFIAVLTDDGEERAVGYVFFWNCTTDWPWIGIAVSDDYHGQGVGNRLMEYIIKEAKAGDKKGLVLNTNRDNFPAQKLYQKFGFVFVEDPTREDFLMKLTF